MPDIRLRSAPVTWPIANQHQGAIARGANGYVEFEADAVAVFQGGLTWLPSPQRAEVEDGVMEPIDLPINDPDVWNWKVTPRVGVNWPPFHINVEGGGTNLSSAAIVPGKGPVKVLQGPQGGSVVGAEDQGDGTIRFVLDDGTRTDPMPITRGPAGPPNKISIGTVTKGESPYASLIGAAPEQTLNLVLPKGDPGNPEDLVDATTEHRGLMSAADKVRMEAPGVYAVDYGAVGDGVTDDSAALNAAAADAGGRILHLTAGATYSIKSAIVLSDGITVEGHGATLTKPADAIDGIALTRTNPGGTNGYGSGGGGITIRNLTIEGNYSPSGGFGDATSWFHHVSGLVIERCVFRRGVLVGHYIDLGGCEEVVIRECRFEGANPVEGREFAEAVQVDCSTYSGSSDKTQPLDTYDGLPTRGVTVTGCEFRTSLVDGVEYPMPSPFGIHSNALTTEDGYYENLVFSDNSIIGWVRDTTNYWAAWVMLSGVRGAIIARNMFTNTGRAGAASRGVIAVRKAESAIPEDQVATSSPKSVAVTRYPEQVTIADNVFRGFADYWGPSAGGGLITLFSAGGGTGIGVSGNRIGGCNGLALDLRGSRESPVIVTGNSITARSGISASQTGVVVQGNSLTGAQSPVVGIATSGTSAPVQCISNLITGFPTGITVSSADNGLVQGNFVDYYTLTGIRIGQASGATAYDVTVSGNRMRAPGRTESTVALHIAATSTRCMRFGNRTRDGGDVLDEGSGTISSATDTN